MLGLMSRGCPGLCVEPCADLWDPGPHPSWPQVPLSLAKPCYLLTWRVSRKSVLILVADYWQLRPTCLPPAHCLLGGRVRLPSTGSGRPWQEAGSQQAQHSAAPPDTPDLCPRHHPPEAHQPNTAPQLVLGGGDGGTCYSIIIQKLCEPDNLGQSHVHQEHTPREVKCVI